MGNRVPNSTHRQTGKIQGNPYSKPFKLTMSLNKCLMTFPKIPVANPVTEPLKGVWVMLGTQAAPEGRSPCTYF